MVILPAMDFRRSFPVARDRGVPQEIEYRGFAIVFYGVLSEHHAGEEVVGSVRPVTGEAIEAWDAAGGLVDLNTQVVRSSAEFFALAMVVVDALLDGGQP